MRFSRSRTASPTEQMTGVALTSAAPRQLRISAQHEASRALILAVLRLLLPVHVLDLLLVGLRVRLMARILELAGLGGVGPLAAIPRALQRGLHRTSSAHLVRTATLPLQPSAATPKGTA